MLQILRKYNFFKLLGVFKVAISEGNARNTVSLNEKRIFGKKIQYRLVPLDQNVKEEIKHTSDGKQPKRTCLTKHNHTPFETETL